MSANSSFSSLSNCTQSRTAFFIYLFFSITKTVLLPLSVLVLYLGHQRWRRQRCALSHSDIIAQHTAAAELIYVFWSPVYLFGLWTGRSAVLNVGMYVWGLVFPGLMFFHILTCLERYVAVVHPVTYMGLRQSGGVRIRNISIAVVWLFSCGWSGLSFGPSLPIIPLLCVQIFSLIIVSFCSVRVLCVLILPGPGEVGGNRERVDQSKQRAFLTITAITGVLWLWFGGSLFCIALEESQVLSSRAGCVVMLSGIWFNLPSSLISPLMFLHRAGKLLN